MISPVPLHSLLHRTDITRVHYTPAQLPPRNVHDGLTLMAQALAYLPVSVVRIERGVPTRVIRTLHPDERTTHRLVPNLTAYAWAFTHQQDDEITTFMLVVAHSEVRAPWPNEPIEFWGRYGLLRGGEEVRRHAPDAPRPARTAAPTPAPAAPQRRPKPPKPRPDGRAGKKGPKNKGRKRR